MPDRPILDALLDLCDAAGRGELAGLVFGIVNTDGTIGGGHVVEGRRGVSIAGLLLGAATLAQTQVAADVAQVAARAVPRPGAIGEGQA